jgi:hypothetical protein
MRKEPKINGIRLRTDFVLLTDHYQRPSNKASPLFRALADVKTNMVFTSIENESRGSFVSAVVSDMDAAAFNRTGTPCSSEQVALLSFFPHHNRLLPLNSLFQAIESQHFFFHAMTSSHAMITFIIPKKDETRWLKMINSCFDQDDIPVSVEQKEEKEQLSVFIRQQYPSAKAYYEEEKIKTYGIDLHTGLGLLTIDAGLPESGQTGQIFASLLDGPGRFSFTSARKMKNGCFTLNLICASGPGMTAAGATPVDMIHFYGPHFGDRHSIFYRTADCLARHQCVFRLAGCTGASISIILPQGTGEQARQALADVFQDP